jgi:membrane protein DedA with SNARE-associated domain
VTELAQSLMTWLSAHTYAVVFLATLIDATAIPFPGRIILAAAGAFAAAGERSATMVIVAGTAGVVVTDHIWYFVGPLGGDRLLRLYCRLTFSKPDCVRRTTDWFKRFGALVIVVGRFVAVVRILTWPLVRGHGVGYPTFLALDLVAALAWTSIWVGLGWLLGDRWANASAEARWVGVALGIAGALTFLGFQIWRRLRQRPATV